MKKDELHQLLRSIPHSESPAVAAHAREILLANGVDPSSVYQQMEMSSRFVDAHSDISFPGDVIPAHTHPFHEMIFCVSGSMNYMVGSQQYHLQRGDILSIPMGVTHTLLIPEQYAEPYRRYVLWTSPEFGRMISSMFLGEPTTSLEQPYFARTSGTSWEYLGQYFRRCVQECEQKQYRWDTAVYGIATELVVQLARFRNTELAQTSDKPELLDQIINYVEAHLAERITVADIAARFWVSQSTVSQLFRKKMGISFYRYVTQRRLMEAKLMIKTGIPMEQVSISVGFQDYSTFYRAFKSEFGLSPAQFRKQN